MWLLAPQTDGEMDTCKDVPEWPLDMSDLSGHL